MKKSELKQLIKEEISVRSRIDQLEQAQDLIYQAIELIAMAVQDTGTERQAQAYTIAHLDNWASGGNPYDLSIPAIIAYLEKERYEDQEEYEDEDEL